MESCATILSCRSSNVRIKAWFKSAVIASFAPKYPCRPANSDESINTIKTPIDKILLFILLLPIRFSCGKNTKNSFSTTNAGKEMAAAESFATNADKEMAMPKPSQHARTKKWQLPKASQHTRTKKWRCQKLHSIRGQGNGRRRSLRSIFFC